MIVLVEGPDGAGKTTLINDLVNYSKYKTIKCISTTGVPRDWPDQYRLWYELFTSMNTIVKDRIYLIDRCFLSEIIYRTVMSDKKPNIRLSDLTKLLEKADAIIYCNHDKAYDFAKKRGETYVTNETMHKQISHGYDIMMKVIDNFTNVEIINYDLTYKSIVDVYEELMAFA